MDSIIGMEELKNCLCDMEERKEVFSQCGIRPPNLIINLDKGDGQTKATTFISSFLKKNKIRPFKDLDIYLEFKLDGTYKQLKHIFLQIDSAAVYTNVFEGVVALDIAALGNAHQETVDLFMNEICNRKETTFILFQNMNPSKSEKVIEEKLKHSSEWITIQMHPYGIEELTQILEQSIEAYGASYEKTTEFHEILSKIVKKNNIKKANETIALAEKLIKKVADFSNGTPYLSTERLKNVWLATEKGEKQCATKDGPQTMK